MPRPTFTPSTSVRRRLVFVAREQMSVGKCPAAPYHLGINVIRPSVADGDAALVTIRGLALAGDPVGLDDLCRRCERLAPSACQFEYSN